MLNKNYEALYVVISTGRSKELLGKNMTTKELDAMSDEQLDAYYKIYELNYAAKINDHLINTLCSFYSYLASSLLPIPDAEKLREDLTNDYILTTELKAITGGFAASCSKLMAVVSLGITTLKHTKLRLGKDTKELDNENCEDHCKENSEDHCNVLCNEQAKEFKEL